MLQLTDVSAFWGDMQALHSVSLEVSTREVVALVGANAAGKTTTVLSIAGLVPRVTGTRVFEGVDLSRLAPHRRAELGIAIVPEGRRLFPFMTVRENLELGAFTPTARTKLRETLDEVYQAFPVLREREKQLAGSLSGGEQQMCAIGRGLMLRPKLLILDEPTLGLAPTLVQQVFETVARLRDLGLSILLVEQNVRQSLLVADRAYVLENGKVTVQGKARALLADPRLQEAYLGLKSVTTGQPGRAVTHSS